MVHRILGRRLAAAAVLACVTSTAARSSAFCRTTTCSANEAPTYCGEPDPLTGCRSFGAPLFWEEACVSYAVQWNGSPKLALSFGEAELLVNEAFAQWPNTTCPTQFGDLAFPSIAVLSAGPTWCTDKEFNPTGPNSNAILFLDADWHGDGNALALTTVSFNAKTGRILGADLEINTADYSFTRVQLKYVLTHEAGHFFGLDHSLTAEAVMFPRYTPGSDVPVALTGDDIAAICTAYPPLRPTGECNPEPDKGFSPDCGGDVEASCTFRPRAPRAALLGGWVALLLGSLALRRQQSLRSARRTSS